MSFSVRVRTTAVGVRPWLLINGVVTYGTAHSGNGAYQTLTVTGTPLVADSNGFFGVDFTPGTSGTAYLDNAMLVVGSQPANYVPQHPADDLAQCLRYYEVLLSNVSNEAVSTAQIYNATSGNFPLRYTALKPVTPTVTVTGFGGMGFQGSSGGLLGATSVTNTSASPRSAFMTLTVASGLGAAGTAAIVIANGSGNQIAVEANP